MNKDEIGRIVDKRHYDTICKFYDDSVDSIAEVIVGGRSQFQEDIRFIPPTVLRMRDTTCPLMTEELFSPILPCRIADEKAVARSGEQSVLMVVSARILMPTPAATRGGSKKISSPGLYSYGKDTVKLAGPSVFSL